MFEHKKLQNLEEYFITLDQRREQGVYFYRINGYKEEIRDFLFKYYETARKTGVVIEGKIPNPEEASLGYYEEIMGRAFQMDMGFMERSLKKWLPRMNDRQRSWVAQSIYEMLDAMRRGGKNENILKNAYIKFMCWLYYKFERIINHLGENELPKILYEGAVSSYELKMLAVLSKAGCDVVLVQCGGDGNYQKLDPSDAFSCACAPGNEAVSGWLWHWVDTKGTGETLEQRKTLWRERFCCGLHQCMDQRRGP